MNRGGDTPTPPSALFSVFADSACTTRPIVGQSYNRLYIKVNSATTENEYGYGAESSNDFEKLDVVWSDLDSVFDVHLYVDFSGQFSSNPIPADTVIIMENNDYEITIGAGAVFDFG